MYVLDLAIMMAQSAGQLLKSHFQEQVHYRLKADNTFVSEVDLASHHMLKRILEHHYPDHGVFSEEDQVGSEMVGEILEGTGRQELVGTPGESRPSVIPAPVATDMAQPQRQHHSYLWVLDPLDGTSNYIHKLPYFCVNIGCVELFQDGSYTPLVGVTYHPMSGELYYAEKGYGAYKEGGFGEAGQPRVLQAMPARQLSDAFVACGFHGDHLLGDYESQYTALIKQAESSRRLGAAALDLARTAEGVFHVFFDDNVKIWDYIAGSLMIEEAGGRCYAFPKCGELEPQSIYGLGVQRVGIIAGAPGVVDEVYAHFKPAA